MKALVTGAGALLGQGIIRSLQRLQPKPYIIAVDPNPLSAGLYWADARYLVPLANAPSYIDAICVILDKEKPDIVFIGTDVELMTFAEHRQALESEHATRIVVSPPHVISIADDKYRTYEFLRDNGFPYPETCLPGQEHDLIARVGFPLVVKPRIGARSIGVHVVHSPEELQQHLNDKVVIQECVGMPDAEYTAGVVSFDQSSVSIVMRRDLRDGNTYRAYVDDSIRLNEIVRNMALTLGSYGPTNFQFRLSQDGLVKVFEINARFSGTTILRALSGFDEVALTSQYILSGIPLSQPTVRKVVLLRHWSETVVELGDINKVNLP